MGPLRQVKMEKLEGKNARTAPSGDSNHLPFESTDVERLRLSLDRWFSTDSSELYNIYIQVPRIAYVP